MTRVRTGLENLINNPPAWLSGKRLGLLCNPASVDHRFCHAKDLIHQRFPGQLRALFAPQHGFYAEKQDNMIESGDFYDKHINIPVFSLYGHTRIPTPEMMAGIDILIVDIQDVGTRVYTFFSTLSYCMQTVAELGKTILILDRPNPIGGIQVEGNCLNPEYASFVGLYPIPMRHGLTIAEYARYINDTYRIGSNLSTVPMLHWQRWMYFPDTGLPWIPPSPNLPTPASTVVYPGQVLLEGTNVSEGRGTTQPFEILGAPYVDTDQMLAALNQSPLPGAVLRPIVFEPTSNKWAGTPCHGFQVHVTEPAQFNAYATSLKLLQAIISHFGEHFEWKAPPYEYEWEKLPFDLIAGDPEVRIELTAGTDVYIMDERWQRENETYTRSIQPFLLYR